MSAYLQGLRKRAETERLRREIDAEAVRTEEAAAARHRLLPLDDRLAKLLASIPVTVQREGLSLLSLHRQLRARGRGHMFCHVGELGFALRRLGYVRRRQWRNNGSAGFPALWYPPGDQC
jgi:hypothetical protein